MANIPFTEGAGLSPVVIGKCIDPVKAIVDSKIEAFEEKSQLKEIYNMDTSKHYAERITSFTTLGNFEQVGENGDYPEDSFREGYGKTITHCTFKKTMLLSREMLDDDVIGVLPRIGTGLSRAYNRTREELGAALLAGAYNPTVTYGNAEAAAMKTYDTKTADGLPLFNIGHTSVTGGYDAQSNFYNGELNYDNFNYARQAMTEYRDDDGHRLSIRPNTLIVPNDARTIAAAADLIYTDGKPGTANNSTNINKDNWRLVIWEYLNDYFTSGTFPWFMLDDEYRQDNECTKLFDRVPLEVNVEKEKNDATAYKAYCRFSMGFIDWRFILGSFPSQSGATAFPA